MEEKSKVITWITRIITIISSVGLVAFAIFLGVQLWRSTSYDPLKNLEINDSFKEAYQKNNEILTRPVGKEGLSPEGTIKVTEFVYIKDGDSYDYIQFNVRFNKRHIDEITDQCPSFSYDDVKFVLLAKDSSGVAKEYELKELGSKEKYQYKYFKYEATDVIACDTLVLEMRLMGIEGVKNEGGKTIYLENPASFVSNPDIAVLQEKDGGSYEYKLSKKEKSALNG